MGFFTRARWEDTRSLSHDEAIRAHAMRRCFERFGIALGAAEYKSLCEVVRKRLAEPDGVTKSARPAWRLTVRGRTVWAGWHARFDCIATFHNGDQVRKTRA